MKALGIATAILFLVSGTSYGLECEDCCGHGYGGGPRMGRGPGGGAHHENIHALLDNHEAIERSVKVLDDGVVTVTTSDDPETTETIRLHVRQMEQRMDSGHGLRRWDPLFAELFRHHDKVQMEIEDVPGGVRVVETSADPDVVRLIQQHALRGVSEFVERGHARARNETPLPEEYAESVEPRSNRGGGPCSWRRAGAR